MGLVFFLLSLSSTPPPSDISVLELTVDSHDLYSIVDCAEILARRSCVDALSRLPARFQEIIQPLIESGGGGHWSWVTHETCSIVYYFRYGVTVNYGRDHPPQAHCKPLRMVFKPGSARGALKAGM